MKSAYLVVLLAVASVSAASASAAAPKAAPKAASPGKVGALAIDRQNGFAYGFAYDQATRAEAEARALEEVAKRGGNGTVVLVWSGEGCGAYRTIDPKDGNAYGWGVAPTQAAAEAIADREVDKPANGKIATNRVWACNSKAPAKLKVLKDLTNENFATVKIGNQLWTAENVNIDKFRNGDPIPKLPNYDAFWQLSRQKKPASYCRQGDADCSKFGRFYNVWAVTDERGFAPEGWSVPSAAQFQALIDAVGGKNVAVSRLRSPDGWPDYADVGEPSGFNAVATGYAAFPDDALNAAYFWTTSSEEDDGRVYYNHAILRAANEDEGRIGTQSGNEPLNVRLIAD
jgi:uncharacterized protein (TIGR02145 family)